MFTCITLVRRLFKMYKHELYKIFTKKSLYLVFFLLVLLLVYANRTPMLDWVMKDEAYDELYQTYGGPITEEVEAKVREQNRASDAGELSLDQATGDVYFHVAISGSYLRQLEERKVLLNNKLDTIDDRAYEHLEATKELKMLEKLGNPYGFYKIQAWKGMMDLIEPFFSVVLIAIMILLGLSPVFAEDHSQKTIGLVLATKHGKKRLVSAKLLASITYIGVAFILLHLTNFILQLNGYGGLHGWGAPMQSLVTYPADYSMSPFAWDVWQFYFIMLTVQFLAGVAFGVLVLCLSHLSKNVLMTFFVSGSILALPHILRLIGLDRGFFETFNLFSYLEFMRIERLFDQFKVFNFFGQPVLYSTYLIGLFGVVTLVLVGVLYYRSKHQQVKY